MFLKSIEIRGFKSFADKTELELKNGVTAVVGPNGSGKSNISDAVRWVLGEQSVKSLRGGKMEDVIFAGTQYRKPVGLAQVSLTLDNNDKLLNIDYSDVTVSRRLYRSGESEYYINNTQCRLKDVQELFMDTGIGKEGYSIIGQGKIEAVLSGKPEERRGILEEAAGIVKFKARKEEAEKKLQNTEQNLVRIRDILGTYEERIEPLRIESEKASKFVTLSDELKIKEINMMVYSIDEMNEKISQIKKQLEAAENDIKVNVSEKAEIQKEKDKAEDELSKFEAEYSDKRNFYYENKSEYQKVNSEIDLLNERINNLNESINKIENQIKGSRERLSEFQSKYEEYSKVFNEEKIKQSDILEKLTLSEKHKSETENNFKQQDDMIKKYKNDAIEIISSISENKNNAVILEKEIQDLKTRTHNISAANEGHLNSIKINKNTKDMLQAKKVQIEEQITQHEKNIKDYKKEISALNRIVNSDSEKLKHLNLEYNKNEANKTVLINLEKQYEGYNRSVKTLMSHITKDLVSGAKGKCFVLGEIINVQKKFEVAVEIALGGAISDVVTKDEEIAKKLIAYLKSNNIGRATFLPLNILKSRKLQINDEIKAQAGFIGIASELVTYDPIFTPALNYTLGRTVIAEDMDKALNIAKKSGYSFKIVTLGGEVINPGGSMTGGSIYNKSVSIISRKREITEYTNKIENISREIKEVSDKINSNKVSAKKLDDMCLDIVDLIHNDNIETTKINERIKSIDLDTSKLNKSYEVSIEEINIINKDIEDKIKKLEENKLVLVELNNKENNNNDKIQELEDYVKNANESISKLNEEITSFKVKKAQIDEIVLSRKKDLDRYEEEILNTKNQEKELNTEYKENTENLEKCNKKIKTDENKLIEIDNTIKKLEEELKESEVLSVKIKENIKINNNKIEDFNSVIENKEIEKHKYEITLAKLDTENKNFYNKLNEDFKITYAEALNFKEDLGNVSSYKSRIAYLNSQIREIGTVNVSAIEEYKDVKEKYTFMLSQKEDLDNAKEELFKVIKEMTDKMRTVFKENFEKLRINFKETFRELFKGGNADLILAGDDELTCNIEINVQPPGKKLQNINLMSGGEKGLSAIALLFAILKMKPSPFCILDEIEAALDDANVFRYAEFLKKFSKSTQFIVITHRKGTMEAGDVLYGVTMEEKGVSKVVSVDLNKNIY